MSVCVVKRCSLTLTSSLQLGPESHGQAQEQLHLSLCQSVTIATDRQVTRERVKHTKKTRTLTWVEPGNGRIRIRLYHLTVFQLGS